jgi:shikimate kinase
MKTIYLCGLTGAGKTTLGRAAAGRLLLSFCDLDDLIAEQHGQSVQNLYKEKGEDFFREAEHKALTEARAAVIALGGGAAVQPQNRELLRRGYVIWIERSVSKILEEPGFKERPVFREKGCEHFLTMAEKRAPLYAAIADAAVDNNGTIEEGVASLVRLINKAT